MCEDLRTAPTEVYWACESKIEEYIASVNHSPFAILSARSSLLEY